MNRLSLPIAAALIAASAAVHGAASHRWEAASTATGRMSALHAHAVQLGDYQSEEVANDLPLKEKSVATNRRYFSPSRNQAVVVSLTTGAPGSVATHTPDVCYPGSGYKTVVAPQREELDVPGLGRVSYYVAEFEKVTATRTDRQRVRWAWASAGQWEAPESPRFAYLRVADLAKIYIVTAVGPAQIGRESSREPGRPGEPPAVQEFLGAALGQYAQLMGS